MPLWVPAGLNLARVRPTSLVIAPSSIEAIGVATRHLSTGAAASAIWPVANLAILYPFRPTMPVTCKRLWWYNGATVSGNVDCGIYDASGNRLVSTGSTAQAGINVLQVVNTTDIELAANTVYYAALVMDNIIGTMFRILANINAAQFAATGRVEATTSFVLPNPITFATSLGGSNYLPWFGCAFTDDF